MSAPVVWILAAASAFLLIAGGFILAVARFRSRVVARRRQAAQLGAQLESHAADPFGELQVIGDQLRKIQQRLGQAEGVAGLPVQSSAASTASSAPDPGAPVTAELEQDLDLFKKEVYDKTRRIDELVGEKQVLAEKIVTLETALEAAPAPAAPKRKPKPSESAMDLVDVLQGEADELRKQISDQDQLLKSLEKSDTSGLVKEVGRIRQELLDRNNEVVALKHRLSQTGQQQQLQAKLATAEQEKEALAARALEAAGQLRKANERIAELEQSLVSKSAVAFSGAAQTPPPTPRIKPTTATATMLGTPAGPTPPMPKVPSAPDTIPVQRIPPPTPRPAPPRPPVSRGFPEEPTVKTPPLEITPPPTPKKRKHTGSIFPAPRAKKDLLD